MADVKGKRGSKRVHGLHARLRDGGDSNVGRGGKGEGGKTYCDARKPKNSYQSNSEKERAENRRNEKNMKEG